MTVKSQELTESFQPTCAINRNHVIVSRTIENDKLQPVVQRTDILVYDRINLKAEPKILETYHV